MVKMNYKIIIVMMLSLLLSVSFCLSIGTQPNNDNVLGYYEFTTTQDTSTNSFNLTNVGATSGVTGVIDTAYSFDGINDYMNGGSIFNFDHDDNFSVSFWIKTTETTFNQIISKFDNSLNRGWDIVMTPYITFELYNSISNRISVSTTNSINDGSFHHIVVSYDGSSNGNGVDIYIDGSSVVTSVDQNTLTSTTVTSEPFRIANRDGRSEFFTGVIDELFIHNDSLNSDNVDFLYNNSEPTINQQFPFNNNITQDTIYQQLITQNQPAPVTVTANGYVNVMSGEFNITKDYYGYASVTLSSYSNLPSSEAQCRILIDNNTYDTTIGRTDSSNNNYGSWYLLSSPINLTSGIVTAELECQTLSGSYTFSGGVGKLNLLNSSSGYDIPSLYLGGNITINDSEYLKVPLGNITTPNISLSSGYDYTVIYDAVAEVTYNSESQFKVIVEIDGVNYTEKPRDGGIGDIGIIGGFIGVDGFNASQTIPINVYIKGDVTTNFRSYAKTFLTKETETNFLDGLNYNVTNTGSFSDYEIVSYDSDEVSNVVVEGLLPMTSTLGQDTLTARFKLDGQNGTQISRTVKTSNKYGSLIISNVFETVASGKYNVTMQLYSNNGNIEVSNSTFNVYKTDVIEFVSNNFNITAYNTTGSQINDFNVTTEEGVTIEAVNGVVTLSSDKNLLDFNISSDGYYKEVVVDHNILTNYNATMENIIIFEPSFSGVCGSTITLNPSSDVYVVINTSYNNPEPTGETLYVRGYYANGLLYNSFYNQIVNGSSMIKNFSLSYDDYTTRDYNLSAYHDIREVEQTFISSCVLSVCKNDWDEDFNVCVNGVVNKTYTDLNNCPDSYYPVDYGQLTSCLTPDEENKEMFIYFLIVFMIIGLMLFLAIKFNSLIFIVLGLGVGILFTFHVFNNYNEPVIGVVSLLMTLALSVVGMLSKLTK